jgi:hypothetical protein
LLGVWVLKPARDEFEIVGLHCHCRQPIDPGSKVQTKCLGPPWYAADACFEVNEAARPRLHHRTAFVQVLRVEC